MKKGKRILIALINVKAMHTHLDGSCKGTSREGNHRGLAEERVLFLGSKELLLSGAKYLLEEHKKRQLPPKTDSAVAACGCSPGKTLWLLPPGSRGRGRWPMPLPMSELCLGEGHLRSELEKQQQMEGRAHLGCSPGAGAEPGTVLPCPWSEMAREVGCLVLVSCSRV